MPLANAPSSSQTSVKTVLITGASGGIGYELAKIFAREGYNLVLVARSEEKLRAIAHDLIQSHGVTVKCLIQDLALPSAPEAIFNALNAEEIDIEILINNAGFATYGLFTDTDLTTELNLLKVNIIALTHLTKLFLPPMVQRGTGKILNIASTAAFQPGPLMAVYYASKAYVLSFSEAIANEVKGTGVSVTALCPGPTTSNFQRRAKMESSKLVRNTRMMGAQTVAEAGYHGLLANKAVIVPGLTNQLLAFVVRFLPRNTVTQLVRTMQASSDSH